MNEILLFLLAVLLLLLNLWTAKYLFKISAWIQYSNLSSKHTSLPEIYKVLFITNVGLVQPAWI